jgi:tetratricopeptide (TPR) repeat protein
MSAPRRNDPCPCGSGRRYKDCHGKLDGQQPAPVESLLQQALGAHQQGRVDEAARGYREVLARDASNAVATHYLGLVAWQRGDAGDAESKMRASLELDASIPDFHNNLGLLLRDTGRREAAIDAFRAALRANPDWIEAYSNLGLALEGLGRWDEATDAYREAINRNPQFAVARQNLARTHLMRGDLAAGWSEYRWRHFAQGASPVPPDPTARPLPASLAGKSITEQGIGDVLFFLRFAPELVRRGARLAFRGDARLHSMLLRTGLFELGAAPPNVPASGFVAIPVGDLPWLLEMNDAAKAPGPLALEPEPQRVDRMREAIRAHGAGPCVALTWRGGTKPTGPAITHLKEVDPAALGAALRGHRASWISVQRFPREGEREALSESLGAPVLDMSSANDDLEDMLALLSIVDSYIGVSNANTYLRAATSTAFRVMIPFPPEWRWGLEPRSAWFPEVPTYRQRADGDWSEAFALLRGQTPSQGSVP